MNPFPTCKITVLKRLYHADLVEQYRRPDVRNGPCDFFTEGQEFIVNYLTERPEHAASLWVQDILRILTVVAIVIGVLIATLTG